MERLAIIMDVKKKDYYNTVRNDFVKMKEKYPFAELSIPPSVKPEIATVKMIAASKELIELTYASEEDFKGEYSKELFIEIPFDYKEIGCRVYGADWVDLRKFKNSEIHFNGPRRLDGRGYLMCVGVTESFRTMDNVLLECVKTADMMLIAYREVMTGCSNRLNLRTYSHGDAGISEYKQDREKYGSKKQR